jgi:hypothetical protein
MSVKNKPRVMPALAALVRGERTHDPRSKEGADVPVVPLSEAPSLGIKASSSCAKAILEILESEEDTPIIAPSSLWVGDSDIE